MAKIDLSKDKISKLLVTFAVPCVISMLVNSVYNIVDQIFIGQGVGTLGNAATNVIFPLVIIFNALAGLIGNGASANLSLKLGEGDKKSASSVVGSAISLNVLASIALSVIAYIFLPKLVYMFGCTDSVYEYALSYGRIIVLGAPFMVFYSTLSSLIRSDGAPKYSMFILVVGAIINIILDPIFIFGFNMGVAGGAIATVISQVISAILAFTYIYRFKSVKITRESLKINRGTLRSLALGLSSFITQMTVLALFIYMNNVLTSLGAGSKFGADVPLSSYGIVSKISNLYISTVLGIAIGAQPIVGFNYGAGNYERVKKAIRLVVFTNLVIGLIFNVIFQLFPQQLAGIFISADDSSYELFMEFAVLLCRVFLMIMALNAVEMSASITIQSLGNVKKSIACSFIRQILLFIPISLILAFAFNQGVYGILYAGSVADGLTFIAAIFILRSELKKLDNPVATEEVVAESKTKKNNGKHIIITIAREYGSGGRYVGKILAEKLKVNFYDKELISLTAKESGLSEKYIEESDEKRSGLGYEGNNDDRIYIAEKKVIEKLAKNESCIIVGRCANHILKKNKDTINVFLYTDIDSAVNRGVKYYGLKKKDAAKIIERENKERAKHYKYYTDTEWRDLNNYDIALNVDKLGVEKTADNIIGFIKASN